MSVYLSLQKMLDLRLPRFSFPQKNSYFVRLLLGLLGRKPSFLQLLTQSYSYTYYLHYVSCPGKTKTISVCKSGGLDGKNQLGHIGQEEPEMLGKLI